LDVLHKYGRQKVVTLTGIGCYFETIPEEPDNGVLAFSEGARRAGLGHVILKVVQEYSQNGLDQISFVVKTLKEAGLEVWGSQYICGVDPALEAQLAIQSVNRLNLDGFVIQAGREFEALEKDSAANAYMRTLRAGLPLLPIALSAFRFPSYHPHFPWQNFLTYCDYNMPRTRLRAGESPSSQIVRCLREFQSLQPNRPIIPTVQFNSNKGNKLPEKTVREFLRTSQDHNLKGVNLWSWDISVSNTLSETLETVQNFISVQPSQNPDIAERYIDALNSGDPVEVARFYSSRCALVTSSSTYVGKDRIKIYFNNLFSQQLPNSFYELTDFSGTGSSRNFGWRARSRGDIFKKNIRTAMAKPFNRFTDEHNIYQGLHFKKQSLTSPRYHVVHIASIDLNDPDVDLMVTPHNGLGRTTSKFLDTYNLQMAINGDEWLSWTNPKGLAVSQGVVYSQASNEPTIYISPDNQVQIGGDPPMVVWDAISGSHTLVQNGQVSRKINSCSSPVYCSYRAPRTSVGITADNKLILIVVQGPKDDLRNALTLKELAKLNLEFGVVEAINMDGGGSSAIAVDNYGTPMVVNKPSDGSERAVSNHLGISARYLDLGSLITVDDGNDTFGLVDDKVVYHYTSFSIKGT
jgi:hypothetical protein